MALNCTFPLSMLPPPPPPGPAWVDPAAVMALAAVRFSTVSLAAGTNTRVARADPKRIAIGFAIGSGGGGSIFVGPNPTPGTNGWQLAVNVAQCWFSLFTYGPLVNLEWYGFTSVPLSLPVYELYRQL